MIPILFESTETLFTNNGLGRLRDCISATVVEERNSIFEMNFEYPVDGANYDLIQIGRIVGVTHDDSDDIEPFDIVSFTRPIDGIVSFHCTHISYRLSYMTVTGTSINSLADTFALFATAEPSMPFTFSTDKTSTGYLACADGTPHTVRQMMGGIEGSILDAYGGEYSYNNFNVHLHASRGVARDFAIRYGVNMLDYNEELDSQGTYSSCVPYWTDGTTTIVGDRQDSGSSTVTGRGECVPLDVSERFETQPTKAEVEAIGLSVMNSRNPMIPSQSIHVEFVRLQDMGYEGFENLLQCKLCDTIKVIFPYYNTKGDFKIVKTVWDVLMDRYESMELGDLSVTLSEALGISSESSRTSDMTDYIVEEGTDSNGWTYRKWNSGIAEGWKNTAPTTTVTSAWGSGYLSTQFSMSFPSGLFVEAPRVQMANNAAYLAVPLGYAPTKDAIQYQLFRPSSVSTAQQFRIDFYAIGKWK